MHILLHCNKTYFIPSILYFLKVMIGTFIDVQCIFLHVKRKKNKQHNFFLLYSKMNLRVTFQSNIFQ